MTKNIIPIILCGGKGTRLWPLSRESYPKQYLSLYGNKKDTLLQQTQNRIKNLRNIDNPIIICNQEHRFIVAEQLRGIDVTPKAIILETEGRNTAPAIALGAIKALEENQNSLILVLSADHVIKDIEIFHKSLKVGFEYAERGNLVTFGVIPNRPETGYGYIESESILNKENIDGIRIKKFIEKPNKEEAKKLIKSKRYSWNSGMFIFKTKLILDELNKYSPLILHKCKEAMDNSQNDLDFIRIEKSSFSKAPNLPIDVAVMEKTNKGVVIPLEAGWSDIGSWKSLWENEKKDLYDNVIKGKVINHQSSGCFIKSDNKLLVTIGLNDLVVVETSDATLVANKKNIENLKPIIESIKEKGFKEVSMHKKIYRPWGSYTSLIDSAGWLVKKIEVKPHSKLSLQMHNHRSEHWTVVEGTAKVEINEKSFILSKNQSTYIPLKAKHRLSNPGGTRLTLIEVQSGNYIGEDDIIRFEDLYGRNPLNKE